VEENESFAVGHLAFGYLSGKGSAKLLRMRVNVPLILTLSIIPDVDILIPFIEHRGATHSLVTLTLILLVSMMIFGKSSLPYFVALAQHVLLGDFLTSDGMQIFWPVTSNWYGFGIPILSVTNLTLELVSFVLFVVVLLATRDVAVLMEPHPSNLLLFIPSVAIASTLLGFVKVATQLIVPHYVLLVLFALSILIDIKNALKERFHSSNMGN